MSEPTTYAIVIAICYLVAAIWIYSAIYIEMKKAQKIWEEKRR